MGLINNGNKIVGANISEMFKYPFLINYAGKFIEGAYLDWTPSSAPTDSTKTSMSFWVKMFPVATNINYIYCCGPDATHRGMAYRGNDGTLALSRIIASQDQLTKTAGVYRDVSQYYHVYIIFNTSGATAEAFRVRIYINGVQESSVSLAPALASKWYQLISGNPQTIGRYLYATGYDLNGVLAEFHMIDGQVRPVSDFGEFVMGAWVPKRYTGSYGDNGFYLDFADASDLGKDVSGNGNHWTNTNVVQTLDTPTNNFPALDIHHELSTATISGAGLTCSGTENEFATTAIPQSGKWGWEITVAENGSFGLEDVEGNEEVAADVSGEVVEMLVDMDNGTLKKKVDGGALEDIELSLDTTATWLPNFKAACTIDFGADSYIPSEDGYKTLCTANYPIPEIIDGENGLWINTREGTGAVVNVTGASFEVASRDSLVWIKERSDTSGHVLTDTIRGATKYLSTDSSAAEGTAALALAKFLTNGFQLGNNAAVNGVGETYIDWVFNMLPKYGMDIVTWTGNGVAGRTVAHSLGAAPEMVITKNLSNISNWFVYHHKVASDPETDYLILNSDATVTDDATAWNDTAPTSSVFTVGTATACNADGDEYIAYVFRSIPGFSKIGAWTEDGSLGTRTHTGFRPKFVLYRRIGVVASWAMFDSVRQTYNTIGPFLHPNLTNVEGSTGYFDFLSNGFKRHTAGAAGAVIVYLAFGQTAFPYANAF